MNETNSSGTDDVLRQWRMRILNVFLAVMAVATGVMLGSKILDAISRSGQWPIVILFSSLTLMVAALAIFRRIDSRIRAWGVLLVTYAVSMGALISSGLGGSGRLFLLALPILVLILIGVKAGIIMSALSVLTMAVLAFLAGQGWLAQWMIGEKNSLLPSEWISQGVGLLGLMAILMVLLVLFYRFQEQMIGQERQARLEIIRSRALLEQQNDTLEQRVEERTAELASVAKDNARLYSAALESQRATSDIIDFLPDPTLVIDRDGKVIAWNHAIEEMTGVRATDMLGKGDYEYALPFYGQRRPILIDLVLLPDEEIQANYAHMQKRKGILMGEVWVPQLRGAPAYLFANASKLSDSRGEIVGAIEIIRDITDRKQAEEELNQAKAAAETATQAKSAFLATMSHEIRTPMNAVIGMTSLLLDTPLTTEQRDFAETIRTSGDALLTIINDILDFSKIEAGRLDLENTPVDVRECVEGALDLLATKASEKALDLACLIEPQVPAGILGDVTRLRQVLVNLVSNAVKFTEKGEVVVSVSCASVSSTPESHDTEKPEHVTLRFSVRDTGLGIPPDRIDRLFQSFSQVDSSTTRKYGGTGLGLAISRRLVELMGGRMWVESAGIPGQGSTFHFTIQALPVELTARVAIQAEDPDLRGLRVLIVDDNATNRRIFNLQTQGWGMLPRDTGTPAEALVWLDQGEEFDVALIDRQMPDMDGLELGARIKRLRPQLPLVLVTSLGQREAGAEAECFTACLLKPIRARQLYDALVGILARQDRRLQKQDAQTRSEFDSEMGSRLPLSILLAEDYPVNQKLALLMLERLGYRADVAANGLEVLEAFERQSYDVVLMDMQMPEMDGLEATRQIRRRPGASQPHIIAMTANVMKEDQEACFAAGMDDYLSKPIRVDELVGALRRLGHSARPMPGSVESVAPVELPGSTPPGPAPQSASSGTELDQAALDKLLALVGGESALLGELIDSYLQETPPLLVSLRRCLEEGNAAGLRQAAHPLKSSSRDFGAARLSEWARQLEDMGKAGTLQGAADLVTQVEAEFLSVKAALEAVRNGEYPWRNAT